MRYALIAAAAAALISTGAMAQDMNTSSQPHTSAVRAYAPATATPSQGNPAFQQGANWGQRDAAISQEDRLFLMQGDRGLGNG